MSQRKINHHLALNASSPAFHGCFVMSRSSEVVEPAGNPASRSGSLSPPLMRAIRAAGSIGIVRPSLGAVGAVAVKAAPSCPWGGLTTVWGLDAARSDDIGETERAAPSLREADATDGEDERVLRSCSCSAGLRSSIAAYEDAKSALVRSLSTRLPPSSLSLACAVASDLSCDQSKPLSVATLRSVACWSAMATLCSARRKVSEKILRSSSAWLIGAAPFQSWRYGPRCNRRRFCRTTRQPVPTCRWKCSGHQGRRSLE